MIDSVIWKEKLEQDIDILRSRQRQLRWSSRSVVLFERELMLTFFSIRVLIESGKLTDKTCIREYTFTTHPNKNKVVDDLTKYNIEATFDLTIEKKKRITLKSLTQQFIHAYIITSEFSNGGNLSGVLLCSDWEKKSNLIRLPIDLAIKIIEDIISDEINSVEFNRSKKNGELRKVHIA